MVRHDRLLTLCLSRLHRGLDGSRPATRLPILMYHSVSCDKEAEMRPYYRLATSPLRFGEQMQWLSDLGYRGVALEDALPLPANGRENQSRPVVITFDDGFRDFYQAAWPVLQQHGFTASMYLPTAFVSRERKLFRGKECLTWDEVRELRRHGIRFGSHTVTHPKLHEMRFKEIETELTRSKLSLEEELGEEIAGFAFPYAFPQEDGRFKRAITSLLRRAGYRTCVTTAVGWSRTTDDPLFLKRLPVNSCDDQELFKAKLEGAYDWIGAVQFASRKIKSWIVPGVGRQPVEDRQTKVEIE